MFSLRKCNSLFKLQQMTRCNDLFILSAKKPCNRFVKISKSSLPACLTIGYTREALKLPVYIDVFVIGILQENRHVGIIDDSLQVLLP